MRGYEMNCYLEVEAKPERNPRQNKIKHNRYLKLKLKLKLKLLYSATTYII